MRREKFLEIFNNLPTKRRQVLLGVLRGDSRAKIMVDVEISDDALTQHRRQLYKDFQIEVFQNEADDLRSGERKLPLLMALFTKYMPELVSPNPTVKSQPVPLPMFPTYQPQTWVGREKLIGELGNRVRNHHRLLLLVGISGIGKTALGERLAVEVAEWLENNWSCYHQENFDNQQQSSDFASVAARWLEKWGELISPDDRKDPQRLINLLMKRLRDRRYLIQIDSLENILQGNEETGWSDFQDEWWLNFFSSYLKLESCQSCLIITSQDLPGQIETAGSRYKNFWYCQLLSGLDEVEQVSLFEKIGLDISPESTSRDYLERIGKAYEGHPLALRVIGGEIKDPPFGGNVLAYWNKYGDEIEEVEKDIAEAEAGIAVGAEDKWRLDRFTKTLRRNVRSRLDSTFQRLKVGAKWSYILLCEGAVYRCAVPEDWWLSHLEDWDRDEEERQAALDVLRDRYLVEEVEEGNKILLRQHNLIRSISLEYLKKLDEIDG